METASSSNGIAQTLDRIIESAARKENDTKVLKRTVDFFANNGIITSRSLLQ